MRSHLVVPTLGAALASLALAAGARADVVPIAGLNSSEAVTDAQFSSVAASGSTVVAGGLVTNVFAEPATGWVSGGPSAVLADPALADGSADAVAISGDTIVAGMTGAPGAEDVFTEPAAGWSGIVAPAAHLVDAGGRPVSGGVVEGDTIAAFSSAHDAVDIFSKPATGWTGTVTPVATLALPFGVVPGAQLAISDAAVFVPADGTTYVFQEPTGGWAGAVSPSATLDSDGDVSASGANVLAGGRLFTRPATGWSGAVAPAGRIIPSATPPSGPGLPSRELLSGKYAVTAFLHDPDGGCDEEHLCTQVLRAVSEPAAGWSGPQYGQRIVYDRDADFGPSAIALAGSDLVATDGAGLTVYPLPAAVGLVAPVALSAHATGLAGPAPALSFGLQPGPGQPPVKRIAITLPHGLSFNTRPGVLARGVTMHGTHTRRSVSGRVLTLTNPGKVSGIRVSIGRGALEVSPALVRRLRAAGHRHRTLHVSVVATTRAASWTVVFTVHV
jgi:hypothetical protein